MRNAFASVLVVVGIACSACSSSSSTSSPAPDSVVGDSSTSEASPGDPKSDSSAPFDGTSDTSTSGDTSVDETTTDDVAEETPADGAGAFSCGSETCSAKFQYCKVDTSPGACPVPSDGGACPAGCPGCPELGRHCTAMPTDCFAFPSCACIESALCGSVGAGTCDEKDGAFTVGCNGV